MKSTELAKKLLDHDKLSPGYTDRDRVVLRIVQDMCEGNWYVARSHQQYAAEYHVDLGTARNWASDAAMVIRLCHGGIDEIRTVLMGGIDKIHALALGKKHPDLRNALAALELKARMLGAMAPVKVEVQPAREELWTGVQEWLTHPTPELEAVLHAAGWVRRVKVNSGDCGDSGKGSGG